MQIEQELDGEDEAVGNEQQTLFISNQVTLFCDYVNFIYSYQRTDIFSFILSLVFFPLILPHFLPSLPEDIQPLRISQKEFLYALANPQRIDASCFTLLSFYKSSGVATFFHPFFSLQYE